MPRRFAIIYVHMYMYLYLHRVVSTSELVCTYWSFMYMYLVGSCQGVKSSGVNMYRWMCFSIENTEILYMYM